MPILLTTTNILHIISHLSLGFYFSKFCSEQFIQLIVLREVIHKRQDHIAEEDQPLAGACVADMRRLLIGDVQALAENFPVSAGLVQKVHKIAVL